MRKRVIWILGVLAVLYVLSGLAVYLLQDFMLFPGGSGRPPREVAGTSTDWLTLKDGTRCRFAIAKPKGKSKGAIVVFCGNGEDLASGVEWANCFAEYGFHTLVPEYPGYGKSEGRPGIESILELAEVAATEAKNLVRGSDLPLIVVGMSLGSFSAMHVASSGQGDRVVLVAPLLSVVAAGRERFPWLPLGWLVRNQFDNLGKAALVRQPTLVIHGDLDNIVPMTHGQRLAQALPGGTMHVAKGMGHNDLWMNRAGPFGDLLADFLHR